MQLTEQVPCNWTIKLMQFRSRRIEPPRISRRLFGLSQAACGICINESYILVFRHM